MSWYKLYEGGEYDIFVYKRSGGQFEFTGRYTVWVATYVVSCLGDGDSTLTPYGWIYNYCFCVENFGGKKWGQEVFVLKLKSVMKVFRTKNLHINVGENREKWNKVCKII